MTFVRIHYTEQQVGRMLQIAALDSIQHLATLTGTSAAELELIIAGERKPSAGVVAAFELKPAGKGMYVWNC